MEVLAEEEQSVLLGRGGTVPLGKGIMGHKGLLVLDMQGQGEELEGMLLIRLRGWGQLILFLEHLLLML